MTFGNNVVAHIDYAAYYLAVGVAIAAAPSGSIVLISGWGIDLETPIGGASPQETVGGLLARVGVAGVRVRVLLSGHLTHPNTGAAAWIGKQRGCAAIVDDRLRLTGCFHQKSVVIVRANGMTAYVGGMDFGRDRLGNPSDGSAPWHDVQVEFQGPSALDVYNTLASRWDSHRANARDQLPRFPTPADGPPSASAMQVVRTYGNPRTTTPLTVLRKENVQLSIAALMRRVLAGNEFSFAPTGESSIHDLLVQCIRATRETIYLEDQYFIASAQIGGGEELLQALAETIARPTFKHLLVLTAGVGTVQGELFQVNRRRRELVRRISGRYPEKVSVWAYKNGRDRCSWLHAKTWIFDDTMAVIGSANFNRRGLSHDGELGVGVLDLDNPSHGWVRELRKRLWLKHLPAPNRPVTIDQVHEFETGRTYWVDTKDTLLYRMNIEAGEASQPDHLVLCDSPMPARGFGPGLGLFFRDCACLNWPLSRVVRSEDNQWNFAIDPDGT